MSATLPWLVAAIFFVLLFAVLLFGGIIRKQLNLVISAVACFVLFMVTGGIVAYKTIRGTIKLASEVAQRRSGDQVYADILGRPTGRCVTIYASSDPIIPTNKGPVSACFSTCPDEVARLLQQRPYEIIKRPTAEIAQNAEQCCGNYFSYARFGDSLLECIAAGEGDHVLTIWFSTDSTNGFFETR